jgi:Ca2+-binding RTX toxin-like protein
MAVMNGSGGNDFLFGTSSTDTIDGGARRDYISAGGGRDLITGGLGNDILNGGSGGDTFRFGFQHDADVIEDFGRYDVVDLTDGIERYFVTEVWNGIRIATVDAEYTADPVQGSIVLHGVTRAEWQSWGGAFGNPGGYAVSSLSSGTLII